MVEQTRRWRWGVNRWLILLFIILGFMAARAYPPILPHVQLPAEVLSEQPLVTLPGIGPLYLTNTLIALLIVDVLLILMAVGIRRATSGGALMLGGVAGAVEALLEALYNLTESTAGKWARSIFPWMATIVLLVLLANWLELIPGVDSIGLLHHSDEGYRIETLTTVGATEVQTIVTGGEEGHVEDGFSLVPFVRVPATDLNFTLGLALISVVMTQVMGIRALGAAYFSKFFNVSTLFSKPLFGAIDFGVGLLEIISEFSKVLSFAFRLFGNVFAGSILLFVIGTLVPVFAQTLVLMLEFFVGMIQALIFGMLTMVFMSQAVAGHGHGAEEGAH
jgi:F-type H+-transporting ATPase subunit a